MTTRESHFKASLRLVDFLLPDTLLFIKTYQLLETSFSHQKLVTTPTTTQCVAPTQKHFKATKIMGRADLRTVDEIYRWAFPY